MSAFLPFLILYSLHSPMLVFADLNSPKNSILSSLDRAQKDLILARDACLKEKGLPDPDHCKADALLFRIKYDRWYIDHAEKIDEEQKKFDQALVNAKIKMQVLLSREVLVNAVEGQNKEEIGVTLRVIADYLRELNQTIHKLSREDKEAYILKHEGELSKKLKVTHRQIVAATARMTTGVNASLKRQASEFALVFIPTDEGYEFELQMTVTSESGTNQYEFSILNHDHPEDQVIDPSQWHAVGTRNLRLDGYPIDGRERYVLMQSELRDPDCKSGFDLVNASKNSDFFITPDDLKSESAHETKKWVPLDDGPVLTHIALTEESDLYAIGPWPTIYRKILRTSVSAADWEDVGTVVGSKAGIVALNDHVYGLYSNGDVFSLNLKTQELNLERANSYGYYIPPVHLAVVENDVYKLMDGGIVPINIRTVFRPVPTTGFSFFDFTQTSSSILIAINNDGKLYQAQIGATPSALVEKWESIAFDCGVPKQVVGLPSGSFYLLTQSGSIYLFVHGGEAASLTGGWIWVADSISANDPFIEIAANSSGKICALQKKGKVFCLEE